MDETGLAEAVKTTTKAPKTMFQDIEQDETVSRGYVKVTEIIAYDAVGKRINEDGKEVVVEKSRGPYFYQDSEDYITFAQNNRGARLETFGVQLLKSSAIKYMDSPENIKQFEKEGV